MGQYSYVNIKPGAHRVVQSNGSTGHHTVSNNFPNPHNVEGDPFDMTGSAVPSGETQPPTRASIAYIPGAGSGGRDLMQLAPVYTYTGMPDIDFWIATAAGYLGLQKEGIVLGDNVLSNLAPVQTASGAVPAALVAPYSCGASNLTASLPSVTGNAGLMFVIAKVDTGAGTLTIDPAGAETIDGAATKVLTTQSGFLIWTDGVEWYTLLGGGGGSGPGGPRVMVFPLYDTAASSLGAKLALPVPCNGNITAVKVIQMQNVTCTTSIDLRRGLAASIPGTWDAAPLNPSSFGPTTQARYDVPSFTSWTTSVSQGDHIRVEITTEDVTLSELMVEVEITPV